VVAFGGGSDHVADLREPCQDAATVVVAQPAFDVVLRVQAWVDLGVRIGKRGPLIEQVVRDGAVLQCVFGGSSVLVSQGSLLSSEAKVSFAFGRR